MKLFVQLVLLISLLIPYFTKAALYVDIKKNGIGNISLVVSRNTCNTELESELSKSITEIIETNLSNCGLFNVERGVESRPLSKLASGEQILGAHGAENQSVLDIHEDLSTGATTKLPTEVEFRKKSSEIRSFKKSDILVTVNLNEISGSALELSFHLLDTFTKRELLTDSIIFLAKDWRKIGHLISDAIHDRLIGEKGHFNTKITYIAEEKDSNDKSVRKIAVMNQDGSNIKYLTNGDKFVSTPRFSPNGKSIVYISYSNGKSYIILRNLKDNTESVISAFEGVISAPRFSPDGKSLLISHSSDGETNILSLDLNSKHTQKITKNSAISTSPSFSPDQKYMVFSSDMSGSQQLYIIDFTKKNKKPKRISFGNGRYATPVWSPKGDLIAFTKTQSGKFYIGVMKPNGKEERLLSEGHKIESPAWLPNSREIIFTKTESFNNSKLYLVDLVNKNQKIVSTPTNASLADWSYF